MIAFVFQNYGLIIFCTGVGFIAGFLTHAFPSWLVTADPHDAEAHRDTLHCLKARHEGEGW